MKLVVLCKISECMTLNFSGVFFLQVESKLSSAKLSQEKLQSMVVDAETRADAASTQVSR